MNNTFMNKINTIVSQVREYVERAQAPILEVEFFTSTDEEMSKAWHKIINEIDELKNNLRALDYCIYLLAEAHKGVSVNTSEGTAKSRQINANMESLKLLRRCIQDIDDGYYRVVNYFERCGFHR